MIGVGILLGIIAWHVIDIARAATRIAASLEDIERKIPIERPER